MALFWGAFFLRDVNVSNMKLFIKLIKIIQIMKHFNKENVFLLLFFFILFYQYYGQFSQCLVFMLK